MIVVAHQVSSAGWHINGLQGLDQNESLARPGHFLQAVFKEAPASWAVTPESRQYFSVIYCFNLFYMNGDIH